MIPQEEFILIDDIIIKHIDLPDEDIIALIGEGYYKIYKVEIDNMIAKYRKEPYFNKETMKLMK